MAAAGRACRVPLSARLSLFLLSVSSLCPLGCVSICLPLSRIFHLSVSSFCMYVYRCICLPLSLALSFYHFSLYARLFVYICLFAFLCHFLFLFVCMYVRGSLFLVINITSLISLLLSTLLPWFSNRTYFSKSNVIMITNTKNHLTL